MSNFLDWFSIAFSLILLFMLIRLLMEAANYIGNKLEFAKLFKEAANFIRKRFIKPVK